jgi:malate dehydrogenase (oxaloacetate-decarboxylating)
MDRNETLYYRLVLDHLEMMLPIIYTPTVGLACKQFAHIFRRPRGLYITPDSSDIESVIENWQYDDVKIAVITDGERILGLGDLGSSGMGISIGKLALYTIAGGIHPSNTMPICLDVGTNNRELLKDPVYLGRKKKRISPQQLDALLNKVMSSLNKRYKNIMIQFEDFAMRNSYRILDKFKDKFCCFNDDIQGTGAAAAAGILTSLRITRKRFQDLKFVIAGAGSAGIGIAMQISSMLKFYGVHQEEILNHIYVIDADGLLSDSKELFPFQQQFARNTSKWKKRDLLNVIKQVRPDVLIGTTGQGGLFNKDIIQLMLNSCERPLIMPLSNPTSCAEATPLDIINISKGRALVATGSPFAPFKFSGKLYRIGQCNNVYIFPGIGLGITSINCRRVTDEMFVRASQTLASLVEHDGLKLGSLYPEMKEIRNVSLKIAIETSKIGIKNKLAGTTTTDLVKLIKGNMWEPVYIPYNP